MFKKIWKFLNAPLFDLVAGLLFYVLVAFWLQNLGDSFDVQSALIGVCGVISLNIFGDGLSFYINKLVSKHTPQDLDDEN